MMKTKYANAYTEVYEILKCLNEEEYNKIPKELLEVIEENRNLYYEYIVNEEQDLSKQPMLIETKALLLNIFRDYLATPEQQEKIKKWQAEDRLEIEKKKQEKYNIDVFSKKTVSNSTRNIVDEIYTNNTSLVEIKTQPIWKRIILKIKNILKI